MNKFEKIIADKKFLRRNTGGILQARQSERICNKSLFEIMDYHLSHLSRDSRHRKISLPTSIHVELRLLLETIRIAWLTPWCGIVWHSSSCSALSGIFFFGFSAGTVINLTLSATGL